jgi:type II secretory pathway pseudopilin PulG
LVAIAIVGILSGFVAVQLNGATDAGRDARRKADIDVLRKALVYHSVDTGGLYPVQATACTVGDISGANKCPDSFATALQDYIKRLPKDPVSGYYTYQSTNGTDCAITATLSTGASYVFTCSTKVSSVVCSGDCSVASGSYCAPKPAGENGLGVCQRCDGVSLTHINITSGSKDEEGSSVCNAEHYRCNGSGSCTAPTASNCAGPGLPVGVTCADICANYVGSAWPRCLGGQANAWPTCVNGPWTPCSSTNTYCACWGYLYDTP